MKRISILCLFSSVFCIGLFSCKKDKPTVPDMGYNYFPTQLGMYIVYDVDSVFYDDFYIPTKVDSFKFQIKEKIESLYMDNESRPTYRLERYRKNYNAGIPYSTMPWILSDIWAENRTTKTAEKVEENGRFIKLAFPVKENQIWNGNAQNTNPSWDYTYEYFDVARTIGASQFDSVLQVTQMDDKLANLIAHQYYIEKYAKNVGLVYKQVIDIHSQSSAPLFYQKPIMQRITSGFQYTMTLNSYGTE